MRLHAAWLELSWIIRNQKASSPWFVEVEPRFCTLRRIGHEKCQKIHVPRIEEDYKVLVVSINENYKLQIWPSNPSAWDLPVICYTQAWWAITSLENLWPLCWSPRKGDHASNKTVSHRLSWGSCLNDFRAYLNDSTPSGTVSSCSVHNLENSINCNIVTLLMCFKELQSKLLIIISVLPKGHLRMIPTDISCVFKFGVFLKDTPRHFHRMAAWRVGKKLMG